MINDFEASVIQRSAEIPVLVDFWAEWSGPSKIMSKTIEDLAKGANGRWTLVQINMETHEEWARRYGVKSVPTLKLFNARQAVGQLSGNLTTQQIEDWLRETLPDQDRLAQLDIIRRRLADPMDRSAVQDLESFQKANPDVIDAKILLATGCVTLQASKAIELVQDIPTSSKFYDFAQHILNLAELVKVDAGHTKLVEASSYTMAGDFENALEKLLILLSSTDKGIQNNLPQRASIALFNILGWQNPITQKYKLKFDTLVSY